MKLSQSIWLGMVNRKGKNGQTRMKYAKCNFQIAIEKTEEVKDGYRTGKKAIKSVDSSKVEAADNLKLQGSLDIDASVKKIYPEDPRWDYALSYNDKIYYFEIHPAETSEVDRILNKVKWLKNWLTTKAPEINKLPLAEHPYVWIQSGRYAILPSSKAGMKLSLAGVITARKLSLK